MKRWRPLYSKLDALACRPSTCIHTYIFWKRVEPFALAGYRLRAPVGGFVRVPECTALAFHTHAMSLALPAQCVLLENEATLALRAQANGRCQARIPGAHRMLSNRLYVMIH